MQHRRTRVVKMTKIKAAYGIFLGRNELKNTSY